MIGGFKLQLWMWLVDLNYNFQCDWLIALSANKLSHNNLASELVEKFFIPIIIEEIVIFIIGQKMWCYVPREIVMDMIGRSYMSITFGSLRVSVSKQKSDSRHRIEKLPSRSELYRAF